MIKSCSYEYFIVPESASIPHEPDQLIDWVFLLIVLFYFKVTFQLDGHQEWANQPWVKPSSAQQAVDFSKRMFFDVTWNCGRTMSSLFQLVADGHRALVTDALHGEDRRRPVPRKVVLFLDQLQSVINKD